MKNRKLLFLSLMTAALVFAAGCGKPEEVVEEPVQEEIAETPAPVVEEEEPELEEIETDEVEELPEGMARSSLTGEIVDKNIWTHRPIAIMLPTDKAAQPQYGIGQAGVLYECMEEGDMSRQMAIIEDWHQIKQLGNVRSCRDYYVYWAKEWDPILVHFGGPYYLAPAVQSEDVHNITGCAVNSTSSAPGCNAFYRTSDKPVPHNAYTSGEKLVAQCENLGYNLEHDPNTFVPEHFQYATKKPNSLEQIPGSFDAKSVSLAKAFPYTKSGFEYDEASGLYKKTLYGNPQKDGATGEQLEFENIILQYTYYETRDAKGYLAFKCHDVEHDGYLITKGKAVHIKWGKTTDYSPTRYYYDDLTEVQINVGKTFIGVVQDDRAVTIDGTDYTSDTKK